jgi:hypothetical protein
MTSREAARLADTALHTRTSGKLTQGATNAPGKRRSFLSDRERCDTRQLCIDGSTEMTRSEAGAEVRAEAQHARLSLAD